MLRLERRARRDSRDGKRQTNGSREVRRFPSTGQRLRRGLLGKQSKGEYGNDDGNPWQNRLDHERVFLPSWERIADWTIQLLAEKFNLGK